MTPIIIYNSESGKFQQTCVFFHNSASWSFWCLLSFFSHVLFILILTRTCRCLLHFMSDTVWSFFKETLCLGLHHINDIYRNCPKDDESISRPMQHFWFHWLLTSHLGQPSGQKVPWPLQGILQKAYTYSWAMRTMSIHHQEKFFTVKPNTKKSALSRLLSYSLSAPTSQKFHSVHILNYSYQIIRFI